MQTFQHPDNSTAIILSKREARALLEFASDDGTREAIHGVCLRLSPDGTRRIEAAATDGHTLLVLRSPDAVPDAWASPVPIDPSRPYTIVPKPALARAAKACGARESIAIYLGPVPDAVTLACVPHAGRKGEGEPMLASPSSTLTTADPAVPYPDVDRVLPPAREHDHTSAEGAALGSAIWGVSPHYLARLAIVSDAIAPRGTPTVRVSVPVPKYEARPSYADSNDAAWKTQDPIRCDIEGTGAHATAVIMPILIGVRGGSP